MQPWRLLLPEIPNLPRELDERLFRAILASKRDGRSKR